MLVWEMEVFFNEVTSFAVFCLSVCLCLFVSFFLSFFPSFLPSFLPTLVWELNEMYGRIKKFLNFCLCQLTSHCDGFYCTPSFIVSTFQYVRSFMAKSCLQILKKVLDMVLLAYSYIYKTVPFYKMQNIKWYIIACIAGCVSLKLPNVQSMWYEMCYFYKKEKREFRHVCWHTWWHSFLCLRIMRNKNWDRWWALVWQSSHLTEKIVFL